MMRTTRITSAFSLIELMVVIGIVAALLAILLPVLSGTRDKARQTVGGSNLSQLGVTFALYLNTYDGVHPWHPHDTMYAYNPNGSPSIGGSNPFLLSTLWPSVFHDIAPWHEHFQTWVNNGVEHDPGKPWQRTTGGVTRSNNPSYHYVRTLQARPIVWDPTGGALVSLDYHSPTRSSEMLFPASKVVFFDADRAYLSRPPTPSDPRSVLAGDGSVSERLDRDATPGVTNRLTGAKASPYHDTPNGVRGRDF